MMMLLASAALLQAACGDSEIGEACETPGETDECVDGAVCIQAVSGQDPTCFKICDSDTDCNTTTESCNGVQGSNLKACRIK
jgi:hypothetical protein